MGSLLRHLTLQKRSAFRCQAADSLLVLLDQAKVRENLNGASQPWVAHADLVESTRRNDLRSIDLNETPVARPRLLIGHRLVLLNYVSGQHEACQFLERG